MALKTATPNNACYGTLGERWYQADDDPIALLRAEARFRTPWIIERVHAEHGTRARVLDLGCGAGFLANALAREGMLVTGLDMSESVLRVAHAYDETQTVSYVPGDARRLPFQDASFDVVCAMDFLEHVSDPSGVIAEAARVLVPKGTFFFHTFNRNRLAWLVVIKGVEWFVRNTPPRLHVLECFITPNELRTMCQACRLDVAELRGVGPVMTSRAFVRMLTRGTVSDDFRFEFKKNTWTGYMGRAVRQEP